MVRLCAFLISLCISLGFHTSPSILLTNWANDYDRRNHLPLKVIFLSSAESMLAQVDENVDTMTKVVFRATTYLPNTEVGLGAPKADQ